jgi:hypothetical protein
MTKRGVKGFTVKAGPRVIVRRQLAARTTQNRTPLDDELPVGLDPAVVELCHAINEFPGLRTRESCQGFVDGHRPGEPWAVYFQPTPSPPTPDGYTSLEFMTWLCCYTARDRGFDVSVELNAPPPYLNGPGECMYFIIKGRNRHPTEFAQFIREVLGLVFCLPVGDDDDETQLG